MSKAGQPDAKAVIAEVIGNNTILRQEKGFGFGAVERMVSAGVPWIDARPFVAPDKGCVLLDARPNGNLDLPDGRLRT